MTGALKRSNDRKTAASVTPALAVRVANAFGLPSGRDFSCPWATAFCLSICYAGRIEKYRSAVRDLLMHNWTLLKDAPMQEQARLLDRMLFEFEEECARKGADKKFRIHWDGDFFSDDYTQAWSLVIGLHPGVQFWVYTRNADAALILHDAAHPNLSLYFSGDPENQAWVPKMQGAGIRVATVADTFDEARSIMGGGVPCPEQTGKLPLISDRGGACVACGQCVFARNDIAFSSTRK